MAIGNYTNPKVKVRYWWGILYPENMIENWKDQIEDVLQLPFCYCVHDKDLLRDPDEQRKVHLHLIIAFPNTTTYKHACEVFNRLSAPGRSCIPAGKGAEALVSIEYGYDYLIHDTDKCRREGKYQYPREERICGNNFDIGAYIQLSKAQEKEIFNDIIDTIYQCCFESFMEVDRFFRYDYHYDTEDQQKYYDNVLRGHFRYFDCICKGITFKKKQYFKEGLYSAEERKKKIERDNKFLSDMKDEIEAMCNKAKENFEKK